MSVSRGTYDPPAGWDPQGQETPRFVVFSSGDLFDRLQEGTSDTEEGAKALALWVDANYRSEDCDVTVWWQDLGPSRGAEPIPSRTQGVDWGWVDTGKASPK